MSQIIEEGGYTFDMSTTLGRADYTAYKTALRTGELSRFKPMDHRTQQKGALANLGESIKHISDIEKSGFLDLFRVRAERVTISPAEATGMMLASYIINEVMCSDFSDSEPVTEHVMLLRLAGNITPKVWGDAVPGSSAWFPFSEVYRLYSAAVVTSAQGLGYSGFTVFNDVVAIESVSTRSRLRDGSAKHDIGNVESPSYGAGRRDSFPEVFATSILLPFLFASLVAKQLGLSGISDAGNPLQPVISDSNFVRVKDAWNSYKDRDKLGVVANVLDTALSSVDSLNNLLSLLRVPRPQ